MGKVYLGLGLGFSYVLLIRYDSLNVAHGFNVWFQLFNPSSHFLTIWRCRWFRCAKVIHFYTKASLYRWGVCQYKDGARTTGQRYCSEIKKELAIIRRSFFDFFRSVKRNTRLNDKDSSGLWIRSKARKPLSLSIGFGLSVYEKKKL